MVAPGRGESKPGEAISRGRRGELPGADRHDKTKCGPDGKAWGPVCRARQTVVRRARLPAGVAARPEPPTTQPPDADAGRETGGAGPRGGGLGRLPEISQRESGLSRQDRDLPKG